MGMRPIYLRAPVRSYKRQPEAFLQRQANPRWPGHANFED